jgi:regulation of enolase protein 1 (concanavalin A-like superfamily)
MKLALLALSCMVAFAAAQEQLEASKPATEQAAEAKLKKEKIEGWGTALDLAGDCKFETKDSALVITVPGGVSHDLSAELSSSTAPRVLRGLSGDFVLQVKVEGDFRPGADSTEPRRSGYRGAGLVVFADSKNYVRLERATLHWQGDEPHAYTNFEIRVDGQLERIGTTGDAPLDPTKPTWLRLERVGKILQGAVSQDGREWKNLVPKELSDAWKAETLGGVAAISTSQQEFTPRYSELSFSEK